MSFVIPDPRWEEPNLLIPGLKPTGPVVIDRDHFFGRNVKMLWMFQKTFIDMVSGTTGTPFDGASIFNNQLVITNNGYVNLNAGYVLTDNTPWTILFKLRLDSFVSVWPNIVTLLTGDSGGENYQLFFSSSANYGPISFGTSGTYLYRGQIGVSEYPTPSDIAGETLTCAISFDGATPTASGGFTISVNKQAWSLEASSSYGSNTKSSRFGDNINKFNGQIDIFAISAVNLGQSALDELTIDPYQFLIPA